MTAGVTINFKTFQVKIIYIFSCKSSKILMKKHDGAGWITLFQSDKWNFFQ